MPLKFEPLLFIYNLIFFPHSKQIFFIRKKGNAGFRIFQNFHLIYSLCNFMINVDKSGTRFVQNNNSGKTNSTKFSKNLSEH